MTFTDYFKKGIEIVKLNAAAMTETAKDSGAFNMALLFIVLSGVAGAIGVLNPVGIIVFPIVALIWAFIWVGILHILARLFGGKAGYTELFNPMGLSSILGWIAVIPVIGPFLSGIAGLWGIVVTVVVVKSVHSLSTGKAAAVVLIPLVILFIIGLVLAALFVALLGAIGLGAYTSMGGLPNIA